MEDEDDALCPEALLKNLKASGQKMLRGLYYSGSSTQAARKALLWERAVAQRLRKALDMAEAPPQKKFPSLRSCCW